MVLGDLMEAAARAVDPVSRFAGEAAQETVYT